MTYALKPPLSSRPPAPMDEALPHIPPPPPPPGTMPSVPPPPAPPRSRAWLVALTRWFAGVREVPHYELPSEAQASSPTSAG